MDKTPPQYGAKGLLGMMRVSHSSRHYAYQGADAYAVPSRRVEGSARRRERLAFARGARAMRQACEGVLNDAAAVLRRGTEAVYDADLLPDYLHLRGRLADVEELSYHVSLASLPVFTSSQELEKK